MSKHHGFEEFVAANERSLRQALTASTDGAVIDVLTPWTFALDWITLRDVSWSATE